MTQVYSQELRADTSRIIIPALTFAVVFLSLFYTIQTTSIWTVWHFWITLVIAPIGGWLALRFIKRDRQALGTAIFLLVQFGMFALLLYQEWRPGSIIPYLFGILIVSSTMLNRAESGFLAWGVAAVILIVVAMLKEGASYQTLLLMTGPILVNFGLASVAFLSAMEWQHAVETVSELHINVQRRRDELFKIQEELKWANAKLESSNKQIEAARQEAVNERDIRTRFMNHVSHELRTPLNSIVNFAHIVRLGGRGPVTEDQNDYLDRIEKSGWHLLSVLNDLLDMAQIQAGEFNLHLEVCELKPICEEVMDSARGLLLNSPLDLVRDYPEKWPLVYVDRMRIKQALINLLGNAIKYTEEGHVTLRIHSEDEGVHIIVEDTGIGIAPENFERIFKEFSQINESDARQRIGTGLGLPITKHLVERHSGTLTVESEVGKGSSFTLTLPVVNPDFELSGKAPDVQKTGEEVRTKASP